MLFSTESLLRASMALTVFSKASSTRSCRRSRARGPAPTLEVFAVANHDGVEIGLSVGSAREAVRVAGAAAPNVGVGGLHHDAAAIGPIVMEPLPDATRAFGDVRVRRAAVMHLEVLVRTVAKDLRAARSKVDERGEKLLG